MKSGTVFPFMYLGDVPNVFSVRACMAQNFCPSWMDDWKTNHGKISGIRDRLWNVDTSFAVYWTWLIASPGTKANESNDKWGGAPHGWRDARKGQGWGQLLLGSVWQVLFELKMIDAHWLYCYAKLHQVMLLQGRGWSRHLCMDLVPGTFGPQNGWHAMLS